MCSSVRSATGRCESGHFHLVNLGSTPALNNEFLFTFLYRTLCRIQGETSFIQRNLKCQYFGGDNLRNLFVRICELPLYFVFHVLLILFYGGCSCGRVCILARSPHIFPPVFPHGVSMCAHDVLFVPSRLGGKILPRAAFLWPATFLSPYSVSHMKITFSESNKNEEKKIHIKCNLISHFIVTDLFCCDRLVEILNKYCFHRI